MSSRAADEAVRERPDREADGGAPGTEGRSSAAAAGEAPWARAAAEILADLGVDPEEGLSHAEAKRRRARHGANRLRRAKKKSALEIIVDQFRSLVIAILFAAAAGSFALGETVQAIAILVAILVNTAIGFFTELRAVRSMEALRALERARARVRRAGAAREVDADDLVPGDVVLLAAGAVVPADLRLVEAANLTVDEAALTGESVPVGKTTDPVAADAPLAERTNTVFKGTSVGAGSAVGVVVGTGMETEIGRVSELAEEAGGDETPLERRLDRLGRRLLVVILAVSAVVAIVGIVAGRDLVLMVETGVALVVAAVPEGLPIVASVALARGMWRLAKRNALVERLSAVETLGATNVISSDKTGTLTENRMTLARLALPSGTVEVPAADDDPFRLEGEAIDPTASPLVRRALEVAVLCNGADLDEGDGGGTGDQMEIALLVGGRRAGLRRAELAGRLEEVRRDEFDPEVKMMATWHRTGEGVRVAVKGAPEAVLAACTRVLSGDEGTEPLDDEGRGRWAERNDAMAGEGLRALALAEKTVEGTEGAPYEDLALIGLVGLLDPARADVRDAVLECRRAGIHVVMVTGDQPQTAKAIAEAVGLVDDKDAARVVLGSEMKHADALSQEERRDLLETPIFARFDPKQKLDLIQLYKDAGLVVAMTGDGVNDAPALKKADIGVAMGQRGTEVARQAADMVLRDDSFASIVTAIRQGRAIFGNIRKFVLYMLSGNTGEIFAVAVVALIGAPLPLLPLQILYINIVSDVFPALALGVGEARDDVMKRPPRPPGERIMTRDYWIAIAAYGVLIGGAILAVFWYAFQLEMSQAEAVTVSFLAFGFARLWHVLNMRDPGTTILDNAIVANPYVWGAVGLGIGLMLAAAYVPLLNAVLQTTPPTGPMWLLILIGSVLPLLVGQLFKLEPVRRLVPARLGGAARR